ncbi:MAG TPA: glycosyltransferase family 39 protein [Thermomicrobiales bacterium]|nr:glycosyltransferase family 39 protein [Thermomicrobiales bacterium]
MGEAEARGAARRRAARRSWAIPLACLAAVAIFWPCLRYGFAMDDFALLEAGRAPLGVGVPAHFVPRAGVHYRPLAQYGYFFAADRLFGEHPLPFHLANLLLHLLNVALAGALLARFARDRLAAGLATLFFAAHSALFLVIAWAALAGEAIPLLFVLLALWCYMNHLGRRGGRWLAATLLAVAAALLSKQVAVALPPALILYQLLCRPAGRRFRGWRVPLDASAAALLAPLAAYGWFVLRVSGPHASGPYHLVFAPDAIRTALTYALWTADLPRLFDTPAAAGLALAAAGAAALATYAALRRDRVLLFGLGWFALFLAPVAFLPEHLFHYYLYAPLFGAALVLARLAEPALAALRPARTRAVVAGALALALLATDAAGVATELGTNPTMAQAAQGRRALAVLHADHPTLPRGATIEFVAPADHVYYVLGYGAAVRLAYPHTPVTVVFDGITAPPAGRGPVYRYRWTGATIEAVR